MEEKSVTPFYLAKRINSLGVWSDLLFAGIVWESRGQGNIELRHVYASADSDTQGTLFAFYIFLILFLQRWLKTGEEPMRLSVEWEP